LLPGCPLAPSCGAYTGGGDQVYQRGADSLIVCANGGYAATVGTTSMEGLYSDAGVGTIGATGAFAFQLVQGDDGSVTGLGDGAWTPVTLDETALDHADVQCSDVSTRSWWGPASAAHLPVATAFEKPADGFATIDACLTAQAAGTVPESVACADELLLCPSGSGTINNADGVTGVSYEATGGDIAIDQLGISGTFHSDGTFVTAAVGGTVTWSAVAVSATGMQCN
jgi:hypothetical protein